ncbi:MAG TPA: hypothetical protein VFN35_32725, partial [Ktedonobacteraceae bacterium]|nr:hypothetical protein [Ktedonobacteraceae bacterium]
RIAQKQECFAGEEVAGAGSGDDSWQVVIENTFHIYSGQWQIFILPLACVVYSVRICRCSG